MSKIEEEKKQQELVAGKIKEMDTSAFTVHRMEVKEAVKHLKTDLDKGLTEVDAKKRLEEYGANELDKEEEKSLLARIMEQFEDILVQILLAAATISFIIALTGKCKIFIKAILGSQESKTHVE